MKMNGLFVLFCLLVIVLAVHPKFIKKMYNNILGRLLILLAVVYCTMNNLLAGLLLVLVLIIILNNYATFTEGMDLMGDSPITTPQTIGDDNVVASSVPGETINVVTNTGNTTMPTGSRLSDLKARIANRISGNGTSGNGTSGNGTSGNGTSSNGGTGVDVPAMQQTLQSVPSNTLPIQKMTSDENVAPASQGTLDTNTLTENFCTKCASI
jgi:uncharacterized membrane protein YgcG